MSKNPIECPIVMDEDVPQILVDECEPFLLEVEKCIVDYINACPLRLLNYPALKPNSKLGSATSQEPSTATSCKKTHTPKTGLWEPYLWERISRT